MRTGRPKVALILTVNERQRLESLAHRSRSAPHVARRARIILACAEGRDSKVVARRLHVTPATACKWRGRFVQRRLDGLYDEPRPGAPANDHGRAGRAGRHSYTGNDTAGRDTLECPRHGEGGRTRLNKNGAGCLSTAFLNYGDVFVMLMRPAVPAPQPSRVWRGAAADRRG